MRLRLARYGKRVRLWYSLLHKRCVWHFVCYLPLRFISEQPILPHLCCGLTGS